MICYIRQGQNWPHDLLVSLKGFWFVWKQRTKCVESLSSDEPNCHNFCANNSTEMKSAKFRFSDSYEMTQMVWAGGEVYGGLFVNKTTSTTNL